MMLIPALDHGVQNAGDTVQTLGLDPHFLAEV